MNERFDAARRDAEVKSSTVESQFKDMKNTIEQLDSERNFWKVSSQSSSSGLGISVLPPVPPRLLIFQSFTLYESLVLGI